VITVCALAMLSVVSVVGSSRTLYVSTEGNDANDGSRNHPVATPYRAVELAQTGDEVRLAGGRYRMPRPLVLQTGGEAARWLRIKASDDKLPILDFQSWRPTPGEATYLGGIVISGPSYVQLDGIRVENSHGFGIVVRGPSRFIDLVRCQVDNTFSPGIGVWNTEQVRVAMNEVTRTNTNRLRLYGDPQREAPHEAISIAGVNGFEVIGNRVHHGDKEGIDVKEVSRNGVVHANWVHDMPRQGLYADAWFGLLENVDFVGNISERNEWGMVISVEGKTSQLKQVAFRNNLIRDCRASGFFFGRWGQDALREGIRIESNTILRCGRVDHWAGPTGGIDLRSPNYQDVTVTKNLVLDCPVFSIAADVSPGASAEAKRLSITQNWTSPWRNVPDVEAPYGKVIAWPADPGRSEAVELGPDGWFPVRPKSAQLFGALDSATGQLLRGKSPLVGFSELGPLQGLPREIRAN